MSDQTTLPQAQNNQQVAKTNGSGNSTEQAVLRPSVDVIEDTNGITLLADLPGVPKDRLNLQLETQRLTIEGEVDLNIPQEMDSQYAEVQVPRYRRTFTLSSELDGEKANAEFKNGVLKLHIPKAAHAQPRRIEVRTA
jgi:HSP20 family molecular chaperone IbpA